jgi:hypothetical protein
MAGMGDRETNGALCEEFGITRQTLYRHLSPDGALRPDGRKVLRATKVAPVISGAPRVDNLALPKTVESDNLSHCKAFIRRMSMKGVCNALV